MATRIIALGTPARISRNGTGNSTDLTDIVLREIREINEATVKAGATLVLGPLDVGQYGITKSHARYEVPGSEGVAIILDYSYAEVSGFTRVTADIIGSDALCNPEGGLVAMLKGGIEQATGLKADVRKLLNYSVGEPLPSVESWLI